VTDVGDGSAAEDGGAHCLDGERREEDPRPPSEAMRCFLPGTDDTSRSSRW
jgi:hypothetical protein